MVFLLLLLLAAPAAAQTRAPQEYVPLLEGTLKENILGFWLPRTIDKTHGGYLIRFDPQGQSRGDGPKALVTQARMVWFFARMARAGYGDRKEMLAAADHGYRFLATKMWDAQNGGFYWEVDATGEQKTRPLKHLYGQSFGLYAVSEFALASGRKDVLAFAQRCFEVLEKRAHDAQYGGYREFFNTDWSEVTAPAPGYMSAAPGVKLMNTHLHLMEALTTFYRAAKLPLAKDRLVELIQIQSNAVIRHALPAGTDQYERDWTPRLEGPAGRVSYGHDLENIWLLKDACDAAGLPFHPLLSLSRELFAYSMKYGWDTRLGGFFYTGWFRQPADNREKSWWVQSEALVSALTMYSLTREPLYWDVFARTWEFLDRYQIDRKHGEWHSSVDDTGAGRGDKANVWKAAYHNGRAMIESIALLKALPAPPAPPAEPGFVSLFDGQTLSGWRLVGGRGKGYLVEDGKIVCPADGGGNLYTEKDYGDFILRLEWRFWEGGNNGIGIRAPLQGDAAYQGMEIQILDQDADVYRRMNLRPAQMTGSVYDVFAARLGVIHRNGAWNSYEIEARGRRIKTTLNGIVLCDANLDDVTDPAVLKRHPGLARSRGHLGFLGHGTRVEFRNIRLRPLE